MNKDSLKKRYFFKVITNAVGLVFSFFTQLMIPRGLGPVSYGNFSFLSSFFTEVVSFFDMGTSQAFFTKLSQRPAERGIVVFFSYVMAAIGVCTFLVLFAPMAFGMRKLLWPGQESVYICLAALMGYAGWLVMILNQMTDAYGLTVRSEIAKIAQRAAGLAAIAVLFFIGRLNLASFFIYNIAANLLLVWLIARIIRSSNAIMPTLGRLRPRERSEYTKEFFIYTHPLFIYSLAGMIAAIFDRWILQLCGGSIEQGFYGLSYQIGAICFIFSSALTPLIMREFSIGYHKNDLAGMANLFRKYIPMLYSITAFLACFLAVNAGRVTLIIGGGKFAGASLAVAVMALHPIHATYGQLSSSVFLATGRTAVYRNVGLVFMALGLPLTFFLIAPHSLFGLGMGALGLALKMLLLQFLWVNALLYLNARMLGLNFMKYIAHQIASVVIFLGIALCVNYAVIHTVTISANPVLLFLVSGIVYTAIVIAAAYWVPAIFGLYPKDIKFLINKIKYFLRSGR